jgi:hypothetical protein
MQVEAVVVTLMVAPLVLEALVVEALEETQLLLALLT